MAGNWLTLKEAATLASFHADYLRTLIRQGRIKGRKVVTVWLVSKSSLDRYIKDQNERGARRGAKPNR